MEDDEADTDFTLSPELRAELDRRLADFEADPRAGESWEQVKAWLLGRFDHQDES
jgi:putative addiction module component (TIGR02574 family)